MLDRIIDSTKVSPMQKIIYYSIGLLWMLCFPPLPDWVNLSVVYPLLSYIDTNRAVLLLVTTTLLSALALLLLHREKNKEIIKLQSELETLNNKIISQDNEIVSLKKSNQALDVALHGKKLEERIRTSFIPKQFT